MSITHHTEIPFPIVVSELTTFLDGLPAAAAVTVKCRIKDYGNQYDPDLRVDAIALCADWET